MVKELGYDSVSKIWYKIPNMNVEEGIKEIKKDSEVIDMVSIALEHGNNVMYVEATIKVRLADIEVMVSIASALADTSSQVSVLIGNEKT